MEKRRAKDIPSQGGGRKAQPVAVQAEAVARVVVLPEVAKHRAVTPVPGAASRAPSRNSVPPGLVAGRNASPVGRKRVAATGGMRPGLNARATMHPKTFVPTGNG